MSGAASGAPLECARIAWDNNQPSALAFNDIYHSPDGAAETQRVFIEPAAMVERWQQQADFTVAELGFGTGLNLVALLERWQRAPGTRLHYISFERYPLHTSDWQNLCDRRQAAHPSYATLRNRLPPAVSGWHQRSLCGGAVTVHLYWGDASAGLADLHECLALPVDAWWLDGFSPDRNPEMWSELVCTQLAALSAQGTTVTTFTAAGRVRRALTDVGFAMRRVDQRPHKNESLAGVMSISPSTPRLCTDPTARQRRTLARSQPVQIVGAGIAGATIAAELARAGLQVQVFDAAAAPIGASSLPAAVTHSRLLADASPIAALRVHAQLLACDRLRDWPAWQPSGALQCAASEDDAEKLQRVSDQYAATGDWCLPLDAEETSQRTAPWIRSLGPGLWFPHSGAVSPKALIAWLLAHPNIEVHWQHPLNERLPWDGIRIYANGTGIFDLDSARYLELSALGGQLDLVSGPAPTSPLVGAGYLLPFNGVDGEPQMLVGGNYEYQPWSPSRASAHNLRNAQQASSSARVRSVRVTSSDRVPVAGALVNKAMSPSSNRLVSVGHGSLGMTSSHLCAAHLRSLLLGTAPALTSELEAALTPLRFRQRQARRGYKFGARD